MWGNEIFPAQVHADLILSPLKNFSPIFAGHYNILFGVKTRGKKKLVVLSDAKHLKAVLAPDLRFSYSSRYHLTQLVDFGSKQTSKWINWNEGFWTSGELQPNAQLVVHDIPPLKYTWKSHARWVKQMVSFFFFFHRIRAISLIVFQGFLKHQLLLSAAKLSQKWPLDPRDTPLQTALPITRVISMTVEGWLNYHLEMVTMTTLKDIWQNNLTAGRC